VEKAAPLIDRLMDDCCMLSSTAEPSQLSMEIISKHAAIIIFASSLTSNE